MPDIKRYLSSLDKHTLLRLKNAALDSSTSFFSSLLSFIVSFLSVSLTIGYLGDERFGVWMTIASISAMLSFLDLGVGNGLVSQVARSNVSNSDVTLRNTITRGLITLIIISLLIGSLLTAMNYLSPLQYRLNVDSEAARQDAANLVNVFILLFCLNIPLNGILKILFGLQLGWMVHFTRIAASFLSLIFLALFSALKADPVILFLSTYGVQTLAPLCFLPYLISNRLLTLSPNKNRKEAIAEYKSILSVGWLFLVLQIGVMIGWGADAYLISTLASVAAVTQFAIVQRLYQFVSIPVSILNNPLWGAYADAYARRDYVFIRKTLMTSLLGTLLLSGLLSVGVYLSSEFILLLWLDDQVQVSGHLLAAFMIWKVLQSVGHSFSMALNGMHIVKVQVYSVTLLCLFALPLKIHFVPIYGAASVVWSTVIAYTLSTVLFYLIVFRKHIVQHVFSKSAD